jgi:uncharacterized protein with HEPN domain
MVDPNKRNAVIIRKIIREVNDIYCFVSDMTEDEFYGDIKTQKAVVMSLINIGELTKVFTQDFMDKKTNIPWKAIQATRNVAAHKYEAVDMSTVWDTIKLSLPILQKELENP